MGVSCIRGLPGPTEKPVPGMNNDTQSLNCRVVIVDMSVLWVCDLVVSPFRLDNFTPLDEFGMSTTLLTGAVKGNSTSRS